MAGIAVCVVCVVKMKPPKKDPRRENQRDAGKVVKKKYSVAFVYQVFGRSSAPWSPSFQSCGAVSKTRPDDVARVPARVGVGRH